MPPAFFIGGEILTNLVSEIRYQLKTEKIAGSFSTEVDIIIDELRVVRGDSCFMTPADKKRQAAAAKEHGKLDVDRARIYVPPTIVIESMSPGHRSHDRVTKFSWYAEYGVKHFWLLDPFRRTVEEFILERGAYRLNAKLEGDKAFAPAAFPGVKVDLADVWPRPE